MDNIINALTKPEKLYSYSQIHDIPKTSGIYAWYFKENSLPVPTGKCAIKGDNTLLYIGISPSREKSKSNLFKRIKQHYGGNARSSTLCVSLGVLFPKEMGNLTCKIISNERKSYNFLKTRRVWLKDWIRENASVCWIEIEEPWKFEETIIMKNWLPLNIEHSLHPFSCELEKMRCQAKQEARKALIANH